jgi:hypothetical protein
VAVAEDGALLISEDASGTVWRISYAGKSYAGESYAGKSAQAR